MPPVAHVALAFAIGIAFSDIGALKSAAPFLLVAVLLTPIRPLRRVGPGSMLWLLIVLAGLLSGTWARASPPCGGGSETVVGRLLAMPGEGSTSFFVERVGNGAGHGTGPGSADESRTRGATACEIRVYFGEAALGDLARLDVSAGEPVVLGGEWREARAGPWFRAGAAAAAPAGSGRSASPRWALVRWRASLTDRLGELFGERGGLASALVLARREGLDPALRQAFADAGLAHLLAISGFHTGLVYGILRVLLGLIGLGRRRARIAAALATWAYVGFIGFPDAASRAAVIVTFLALAHSLGRPQARWGGLGGAALILLLLDPTRLWSAGFQLSFAGAAGLLAWTRPLENLFERWSSGRFRLPRSAVSAFSASLAATAATTPIVVWHFEQVALLGVPNTLALTPLVAIGVPGILFSLALDILSPEAAQVFAGGVDLMLLALQRAVEATSSLSWASAWTPAATVSASATGVAAGALLARLIRARSRTRRILLAFWTLVGLLVWPLTLAWSGRGTLSMHFLDVGQGDAVAVRTPGKRWLLFDTGPPKRDENRPHAVIRQLRELGARRLDALILTHPDLDHIGGAAELLRDVDVVEVLDPALPAARPAYIELLEIAEARGIPWRQALKGESWSMDGVDFHVLWPDPDSEFVDANTSSVVVLASFGELDLLLTGDAPDEVELDILPDILARTRTLEILKVGHHGSRTSTAPDLARRLPPQVAVVSLGRYNRFGHPDPGVVRRLEAEGARIYRTDRDGSVTVIGRDDGSFRVRIGR